MDMEAGTIGLTIIVTGADVAGLPLTQEDEEVSMQVTTLPFTGVKLN